MKTVSILLGNGKVMAVFETSEMAQNTVQTTYCNTGWKPQWDYKFPGHLTCADRCPQGIDYEIITTEVQDRSTHL